MQLVILLDLGCSAPSECTQHRPLSSTNSARCGGVHHILNPLTIMAVHRGNVTKSLRTTATLADHCGASSAPSGGVHHTRKCHHSIHVPTHHSSLNVDITPKKFRQLLWNALASTYSRCRLWIFFPILLCFLALVCGVVCHPLISNHFKPPKLPRTYEKQNTVKK